MVVTLMIVKKSFALILLKDTFTLSMKMNLKTFVMECIKIYDWIRDIFDNEEVYMDLDFACDEGDMLDA